MDWSRRAAGPFGASGTRPHVRRVTLVRAAVSLALLAVLVAATLLLAVGLGRMR